MPSRSYFQFSASMSYSIPENMNPPQSVCACDNYSHPIWGHSIFQTDAFRTFQAELNAFENQEFSSPINSCSSQGFGENAMFREFFNPMHNDVNVTMGQNQRIIQHMNPLSNPIPVVCPKPVTVDENLVTQDTGRVLVGTVKKRKNAC